MDAGALGSRPPGVKTPPFCLWRCEVNVGNEIAELVEEFVHGGRCSGCEKFPSSTPQVCSIAGWNPGNVIAELVSDRGARMEAGFWRFLGVKPTLLLQLT
jgi:hypothetical protein